MIAANGIAMPVHEKRLTALVIVPRLAVKQFPVQHFLLERADHGAVGVLALQDARGQPGDFITAVAGHLHPRRVDVNHARAMWAVQGGVADHNPPAQVSSTISQSNFSCIGVVMSKRKKRRASYALRF
jgi:hypothetical protein